MKKWFLREVITKQKMFGPWFYILLVFYIVIWIPPVIAAFRLKSTSFDFSSIGRTKIYFWYFPFGYPYYHYFDIRSYFSLLLNTLRTDHETR